MERRLKHWYLPEFRGRMHQTRLSALSPPSFPARRKRRGRRRQRAAANLRQPSASAAPSQHPLPLLSLRDISPIGGIGPWKGSQGFALPEVPIRDGTPGGRWIWLRGRLLRRGCRGDLAIFWPRTGPSWVAAAAAEGLRGHVGAVGLDEDTVQRDVLRDFHGLVRVFERHDAGKADAPAALDQSFAIS